MRRKIVVSLISLFAIFSLGAIFASWYVASATEQLRTLVELHEIEGLRRHLVISLQTVQGDLYTARTPLARQLDAIVANVENLDTAAEECGSCHHRPILAERLQQVRDLIEEYKAALSIYITASANRDRISRIELEAARIGDQILESTEEMSATASRHIAEIADRAATKINRVRIILLGTLAATFGLGIVVSSYLVRSVTGPVRRLVAATERVAEGELGSRAEVVREDEIGLLARSFNDMLDRLNAAMESQRGFFADASHELRTPLTIIRGEAEVALRARRNTVEEYQEALETIVATAGQMGQLVDDLLFLARSDAGQLRYEMGRVPLGLLLEEVVQQSSTLSAPKGLHLELDAKHSITVIGDAVRLRQLFLALADNAIKYSEPGGKITIALRVEVDRGRVTVSDTGIGIPPKHLPHIFERFYRVEGPVGPEAGTGLGLPIAQSIAKAHRTEIVADSTPGIGTTFSILLARASLQD
jgi:signal transduction histidine kinase